MASEVYQRQTTSAPVPVYTQNEVCQVSDFYKDREVLITGGTGFVGKVLLEKLLRSCSGLKRVYLLLRSKKGQGPQSRLEEMFDSPLGLGLLPSLLATKKYLADIVPVDIVANTLICAAWHTATTRPTYVKAYHCASGTLKQQTWGELVDAMHKAVLKYPLPNTLCYPKISVTESQLWYDINLYCKRLVPARAIDMALQLTKREPRLYARRLSLKGAPACCSVSTAGDADSVGPRFHGDGAWSAGV
ncbi:hypothetical protein MTO96_000859 [Rhipicephalus appendiculatus]